MSALHFANLFSSRPALAAPGDVSHDVQKQCLKAYETGQRERKAGAFAAAKSAFAFCSGVTCPAALHSDCSRWFDEVEAVTPSSVFLVSSTAGEQLQGVNVRIDGRPPRALGGRAITFDPGEHALTFECEGYQSLTRSFTFSEGEKLIARDIQLEPLDDAAHAAPDESSVARDVAQNRASGGPATLTPAWIAGGLGVLGGAGFAYFSLAARADDRALNACTPNCSIGQTERVRQQYLAANISLGVGVGGLLAAAAWVVFGPRDTEQTAQMPRGFTVYLGPMTGVVGRF